MLAVRVGESTTLLQLRGEAGELLQEAVARGSRLIPATGGVALVDLQSEELRRVWLDADGLRSESIVSVGNTSYLLERVWFQANSVYLLGSHY